MESQVSLETIVYSTTAPFFHAIYWYHSPRGNFCYRSLIFNLKDFKRMEGLISASSWLSFPCHLGSPLPVQWVGLTCFNFRPNSVRVEVLESGLAPLWL